MQVSSQKIRLSNWLLIGFAMMLLLSAVFSELFQAPQVDLNKLRQYENPMTDTILSNVKEIDLANRIGNFKLRYEQTGWQLVAPRNLPANEKTVKHLLSTLSAIRVKKLYENDSINMANFSLDNPLLSLGLTLHDERLIEFTLGIINPIDNSAYIAVSHKKPLYQIEAPQVNIHALNISDLIDSRIFSHELSDIKVFQIYRGDQTHSAALDLKKQNQSWMNSRGVELSNDLVDKALRAVVSVQGHLILDQLDEEQTKEVEDSMLRPAYTLVYHDNDNHKVTLKLSNPTLAFPKFKIEKRQNIFIRSSQRKHTYVVSKDYLNALRIRESQLQKKQVKKLFYSQREN